MLRLYITGLLVLIVAIGANVVAFAIGAKTWYDFIALLQQNGWQSFSKLNAKDVLWLFFIYPLLLGAGCMAGLWCYRLLKG